MIKKNNNIYPWVVWALGASFFLTEYFARVAPSVMVPQLMQTFHVNALSLGALSGFFYYAYVSMQLPVGVLVDRFRPHRLLTVTALLCAVGAVIFTMAPTIYMAELGRLVTGFGAAFAFVGTLKLAKIWLPVNRFGLIAGLTQALGMLGAAIGEGPLSILVQHVGWHNTMWLIAAALLLISLLIAVIVRDRTNVNHQPVTKRQDVLHGLKLVVRNPQTWINGLFVGLLYSPTAAFAELWGATYVHHVYHFRPELAASAISFIFIGWAIGGPVAGWLSDRIGKRKPIMLVSAFASLVFMSLALYLPISSVVVLFVVLFLFGVSNTGVGVSYALAGEINPVHTAGTSMAFANMASVIIGAIFQPIIGWLLDLQWRGQVEGGVHIFSTHAYHLALLALPLCLLLAIIVLFFVKETHCHSVS